jgi:hypothetical protein
VASISTEEFAFDVLLFGNKIVSTAREASEALRLRLEPVDLGIGAGESLA